MDFYRQNMKVHSLEEDDDDDVFYEELWRQVLVLIAEDDEVYERKAMEARKQGPYGGVSEPVCCNGWPGIEEESTATPAWILNLWRSSNGIGNGNGTGVFIPQGVQSRRKNRSRRKNDRGKAYRRVERMN